MRPATGEVCSTDALKQRLTKFTLTRIFYKTFALIR